MIQTQIDFSKQVTQRGIQQAVDHANAVHKDWCDIAFDFLKGYIEINPMFMAEDVRFASQGIVPIPPTQRAWGGIIRKAASMNLIKSNGQKQVKNVKAHMAFATEWRSLIVKR